MVDSDILQDISLEELPQLAKLLEKRLGRSDSTYMVNFLANVIDWLTRFPTDSYVTIMSPNGDWKTHATFVADIDMPGLPAMVIFSLEDSNEELTNALLSTKRIDWSRDIMFAMVPEKNYQVVYRVVDEFHLRFIDETPACYMFRIDKEEALKFKIDGIKLDKLEPSDAVLVNNEWPHKAEGTEDYIRATIERNDSVGLFVNEELVSWAFLSFLGALASLQTVPKHKRKGYGKVIAQAMSVKMAEKGLDPYGTVLVHNEASKKLFNSLGFKPQSEEATFFVTTHKKA